MSNFQCKVGTLNQICHGVVGIFLANISGI